MPKKGSILVWDTTRVNTISTIRSGFWIESNDFELTYKKQDILDRLMEEYQLIL